MPTPKAPSFPGSERLSQRLLRLWLVLFLLLVCTLIGLVPVVWMAAGLAGLGALLNDLTAVHHAVLVGLGLVGAAVLSGVATLFIAVPMWLFQKESPPPLRPSAFSPTQPPGPSSPFGVPSARVIGRDGRPVAPRPGWRLAAVLIPSGGLWTLTASLAVAIIYLWRPWKGLLYGHWPWLEWLLPAIAASGLLIGAGLFIRCRWRLPKASVPALWLRLRVLAAALAGLAVLAVGSTFATSWRQCDGAALAGMLQVQNTAGLQRYLSRHPVCDDRSLQDALALALSNARPDVPGGDIDWQNRQGILDTLIAQDRWTWRDVIYRNDPEMLQAVLRRVKQVGRDPAEVLPAEALSDAVRRWVIEGDFAMLKHFTDSGLRFDRPGWEEEHLALLGFVLEDTPPSWAMYDALRDAGLSIPSPLQGVVAAIRVGSVEPVAHLPPSAWWIEPDPEHHPSYALITLALLHTNDAALRAGFMAKAGVDESQLLLRVPLPTRCLLVTRFGAEAILASLKQKDHAEADPATCRRVVAQWHPDPQR